MNDADIPPEAPDGSVVDTKASTIRRIGGYLHRVIPVVDKSGKVLSFALQPLMVEFKPRDVLQVMVGAVVLALPVSMSEEAWTLAEELPTANIVMMAMLSTVFVGFFVFLTSTKGFSPSTHGISSSGWRAPISFPWRWLGCC